MFTAGFLKIANKVFVYRNIRKSKDSYTYSVRGPKGVEQHVTSLLLTEPEIKVSPTGRERVRKEKAKNVHAGIKGKIGDQDVSHFSWKPVTYDPYKYDSFVYRDSKALVNRPDAVLLTPKGVEAGFKKISEVIKMRATPAKHGGKDGRKTYALRKEGTRWSCSCPDFVYRHAATGTECKHIRAHKKGVKAWELKKEVA